MEKLSSGLRINNAADDAAGLAISEKMRGQVRGLDQASRNAQDGVSMIQTAEGALQETHNILQRMRELATQAANDTNVTVDRDEIQKEMNALTSEINRIGNTTEFNTQKLINGEKTTDTIGSKANMTFDIAGISAGDVTVNGISTSYATDAATTAGNLKTALEADADFASKYTVAVTTSAVTITAIDNGVDESLSADLSGATGITDDTVTTDTGADDGTALNFQIGANENQSMSLEFSDMRASALNLTGTGATFTTATDVTDGTNATGVESALDVSTHENAANAITVVNDAIEQVSGERSKMGAYQNRLEHTISNLGSASENLQAAESRIRDVDMAKEVMEMTRTNILSQASQAMLAQANQKPQSVLQLLG